MAQPGVTILGKGTGYGPGLDLAGWARSGSVTRLIPGVGCGRAGWVEIINVVKKGLVGGDEQAYSTFFISLLSETFFFFYNNVIIFFQISLHV